MVHDVKCCPGSKADGGCGGFSVWFPSLEAKQQRRMQGDHLAPSKKKDQSFQRLQWQQ